MVDRIKRSTRQLATALNGLGRLFASRQVYSRIAEAAGVSTSQQGIQVLYVLADGGERPVAGLADEARMDIAAVSRALRGLEADGLVRRRTDRADARVVLVSATASGARVAGRILDLQHRHLDKTLSHWSNDDRARLADLLARLVADLRATGLPATRMLGGTYPETGT